MQARRQWGLPAAVAVLGGLLGVAFVWLNRPEPPPCVTLDDGMRACLPIHVIEPPLWVYVVFAMIGALLAGGTALVGCAVARRGRRH